jgi:WD40 repeat protein
VYDDHWFAQYIVNAINKHLLLLYISALPFTPANTSIYETFYHTKVVCGVEKIWPQLLQLLQGHNDGITSVTFLPNGSKIISGSYDQTIQVWDVHTGIVMLPPLQGHEGHIYLIALSPDGSKIGLGSNDNII